MAAVFLGPVIFDTVPEVVVLVNSNMAVEHIDVSTVVIWYLGMAVELMHSNMVVEQTAVLVLARTGMVVGRMLAVHHIWALVVLESCGLVAPSCSPRIQLRFAFVVLLRPR